MVHKRLDSAARDVSACPSALLQLIPWVLIETFAQLANRVANITHQCPYRNAAEEVADSIAQRMSWAANREETKVEDGAYIQLSGNL